MKTLLYVLTLVILYANLPQPFYDNSMNELAMNEDLPIEVG